MASLFDAIVVPGHGPIGGEEEVRDLQAYLRACVAAEGDPGGLGDGPWVQLWPHRHGTDAMFISLIRKP